MPKQKQEYKLLTQPQDPSSKESILQWLAETGWIQGFVRKKISPLDRNLLDDYIQECWVQIISNKNLVEMYGKGKGKFVNYLKSIILNQIYSSSSATYKNLKQYNHKHIGLDSNDLSKLSDCGSLDVELRYPVINREDGLRNRVEFELETEIIRTKQNENRFDEVEID